MPPEEQNHGTLHNARAAAAEGHAECERDNLRDGEREGARERANWCSWSERERIPWLSTFFARMGEAEREENDTAGHPSVVRTL